MWRPIQVILLMHPIQDKSSYEHELRNQVSIIKKTIGLMKGRATYGSFEKFLEHLSIIDQAAAKIADQIGDGKVSPTVERYKKILVPYDGSKHSKKALNEVLEIARKFGSEVYLISVAEVSEVRAPGSLLGVMQSRKMKKLSSKLLEAVIRRTDLMLQKEMKVFRKNGIDAYYHVLTGSIANSILNFAKKYQIDLIIIGSRGLSGISRIMTLGSVSRKVSEEADCPVMIIH